MNKKKCQISLEYVMIIGFVFFVASLFLYIFGDKIIDSNKDNTIHVSKKIADMINIQIEIAARAYDGYKSEIKMPLRTSLYDYNMSILGNNTLIITVHEFDYIIGLSNNSIGFLCLNDSLGYYPIVVRKTAGQIEVSSCVDCDDPNFSLKKCLNSTFRSSNPYCNKYNHTLGCIWG
jgi:hypothetical protein